MREQLLGYLLGVLDDAEQKDVQSRLERDPRLLDDLTELKAQLEVLDSTQMALEPSGSLAERTCVFVDEHVRQYGNPYKNRVGLSRNEPLENAVPSKIAGLTLADFVVAAGVMVAAAMLFFPAIASSRHQARLASCQNNLRHLGAALSAYSRRHAGEFPAVPTQGNLGVAGSFAPQLMESGDLTDDHRVLCAGAPEADQADDFRVPSIAEILAAHGAELSQMQQMMGGSYGYNLGVREGGRIVGVRDQGRTHFALMADAPAVTPGRNSPNHAGQGQNVLFECGRVRYLVKPRPGDQADDFFLSARGFVEAGLHRDDAVVARSAARPAPWQNDE